MSHYGLETLIRKIARVDRARPDASLEVALAPALLAPAAAPEKGASTGDEVLAQAYLQF